MKLKIDEDSNNPDIVGAEIRNRVSLPQGLFGFADLRSLDLVYDEEELPFMWLREEKKDGLAFIVLEPGGIIPNYSVEVSDADVNVLGTVDWAVSKRPSRSSTKELTTSPRAAVFPLEASNI